MIDFLYFGEANVYQENLDSFLAVAEELQLKGLMGSGAEEQAEEINKPTIQKRAPKPVQKQTHTKQESPTSDISNSVETVEPSPPLEGTVAVTDYTVAANLQDLDDKIKSMMEVSENHVGGSQGNKRKRICKVCGKEGSLRDTTDHIEANHITGVSHTCNICGTITRTMNALRLHNRKHK